MLYKTVVRLEPLGALDTVMPAEAGEILRGFGVLPLSQMLG